MRVVSGAGEFEIEIERMEVRPDALVAMGKMGVWEAQTFVDIGDLLNIVRLSLRPRVLVWVARQLFAGITRRLRRGPEADSGAPGP